MQGEVALVRGYEALFMAIPGMISAPHLRLWENMAAAATNDIDSRLICRCFLGGPIWLAGRQMGSQACCSAQSAGSHIIGNVYTTGV